MIVDGKVRKMKFSERVRENFERFKDRIEGLGRKALIGGILIGGTVGIGKSENILNLCDYYGPLTDRIGRDVVLGADTLRKELYSGCRTDTDTVVVVRGTWMSAYYLDPATDTIPIDSFFTNYVVFGVKLYLATSPEFPLCRKIKIDLSEAMSRYVDYCIRKYSNSNK